MTRRPVPSWLVLLLTGLGLVLVLTVTAVLAVATLLAGMGDELGGRVFRWVAVAIAVPLAVDLICLILALGVNSASDSDPPEIGE